MPQYGRRVDPSKMGRQNGSKILKRLPCAVCMLYSFYMEKESSRATHFQQTRVHHSIEIAEDYTELIADLMAMHGKVRVCDLAREMGITHVAVLKNIRKLIRDGLLIKDSDTFSLTQKGRQMAEFSKRKHDILTRFLLQLGVPKEVIATDVEGIEHHISPPTLAAIEAHLNKSC